MRRIALPALLLAIGATLIVAALVRPPLEPGPFHGTYLGDGLPPADFVLDAGEAGAVSLADFEGRAVLLFFGYTSCPDICPLTMSRLGRAVELLGPAAVDVQVVFVSVDPEVDSPARALRYARAFDSDFLGATGDAAVVREAARRFGIHVGDAEMAPADHTGHGAGASREAARLVAHSPHVYGIDRSGVRRLIWSPDVTAEQIAADVRSLLRL